LTEKENSGIAKGRGFATKHNTLTKGKSFGNVTCATLREILSQKDEQIWEPKPLTGIFWNGLPMEEGEGVRFLIKIITI